MTVGNTKITVCILAALSSMNAYAVRHGSDVSEADYRDHTVHFQVKSSDGTTSECGGLLIAGEYILTAGHCSGNSTYSSNYTEYLPWIDNGASNDISVFVGVNYNSTEYATTYSNVDVYGNFESEYNALLSELSYLESTHGVSKFSTERSTNNLDWVRKGGRRDIALIKLAKKIPQQHQAALIPVFDTADNTYNIESGDTFTFRGWGIDENGETPDVMQKTTLSLPFTEQQYNPNKPVDSADNTSDCSASTINCEANIKDYLVIKPTVLKGTASSGDSGTPMLVNDQAFALASTENGEHTQNFFTNIGAYLVNIADAINKVTAPSEIAFKMDENESTTKTITFQVQNLTKFSDNVSPSLTGDDYNFTVSGCATNLETYESCEVTLTVNPNGNAQTADSSVTLHLNDTNNTTVPVNLTISKTSPTPPTTPTNPDSSGNDSTGGGGSTGFLSLLGLFCLLRSRKTK